MSDKLCVVMPVYNEEGSIGTVLEKWTQALDKLEINYVIRPYNDGSRDSSLSVMRAAAAKSPRIEVHDKPNGGHGHTILIGYREAARDGFDWIFQIDSDEVETPVTMSELMPGHTYNVIVTNGAGLYRVVTDAELRVISSEIGNLVVDVML